MVAPQLWTGPRPRGLAFVLSCSPNLVSAFSQKYIAVDTFASTAFGAS